MSDNEIDPSRPNLCGGVRLSTVRRYAYGWERGAGTRRGLG